MKSLWEGLIASKETKRGSRQYGGIRQKRSLGWLENLDEGTPHKTRGCREDVQPDEKGIDTMQRERGGDREERGKRKRSKERSRVVGRPAEGERKVEVEVEARWR